jgi:hypothetical protein
MAKKSGQLNVRVDPDDQDILLQIEEKHGLTEAIIIRALVKQVAAFYREHGYFVLPVELHVPVKPPQRGPKKA